MSIKLFAAALVVLCVAALCSLVYAAADGLHSLARHTHPRPRPSRRY